MNADILDLSLAPMRRHIDVRATVMTPLMCLPTTRTAGGRAAITLARRHPSSSSLKDASATAVTRVELEHRFFERHGAGGAAMRAGVDTPQGWNGLHQLYHANLRRFLTSRGTSS